MASEASIIAASEGIPLEIPKPGYSTARNPRPDKRVTCAPAENGY